MGSRIDLRGQTFGRLFVIEQEGVRRGNLTWSCGCACGKDTVVSSYNLRSGNTQSCGCYWKERTAAAISKANTTHGMSNTPTWRSWHSMRSRCTNPMASGSKYYLGRGIGFCRRWGVFENFFADMGERPAGTSLERIDNNGHYTPENCKWAFPREQQNNMRSNVRLTYAGETFTVAQWANNLGLKHSTILTRIKRGWTADRALGTKPKSRYTK